MKVSVIVPVYNTEKYIEKCLLTIKNQTLSDFECLVINDGTKDNSIEIAKNVVGNDNRFIFIDKENGGLSDTKNYGIERAQGEYLCFFDSDDYVDNTILEKAYNKAKENDSDIVCFDMYYEYEDGRLEITNDSFEKESYSNNKDILFINNSSNNKLYRTSFMKDKRFIKGMWYEDLAVVPTWVAYANNICRVSEPLYYYVQRKNSISHSADPRIFDVYNALSNIKDELSLSSKDISKLYFDNCLVMTTLRIKEIEDKQTRLGYYRHNADLLDFHYPSWYKDVYKENYSSKQKIVFFLLKLRLVRILDKAYNK